MLTNRYIPMVGSTIPDAWFKCLQLIQGPLGKKVLDERGEETNEVMGLQVVVKNPTKNMIPKVTIPGAGVWTDHVALEIYSKQLINGENNGFDYSYGEQLSYWGKNGCYHGVDQIDIAVKALVDNSNSRRVFAITFDPTRFCNVARDGYVGELPCLQIVQWMIRDNRLTQLNYFRSWDVASAASANLYALARLQEYVAVCVGCDIGEQITFAGSAHVRGEDMGWVDKLIKGGFDK